MRLGKIPFLFVRFTLPLPTENKLNHKTPTVMKKIIFTLIAMLSIVTNANAMSYEQARSEALFLTDKMAYELNLSDAQYEAAYEINLDYLMSVTNRNNVLGTYWERRISVVPDSMIPIVEVTDGAITQQVTMLTII